MGRPELAEKKHRQKLFQEIGAYLSRKRQEAGLRQAEIAKLSGYSSQFISNVECGTAFPPTRLMAAMIEAYGLSEEELLSTLMRLQLQYYKEVYFLGARTRPASRRKA